MLTREQILDRRQDGHTVDRADVPERLLKRKIWVAEIRQTRPLEETYQSKG